MRYTIDTSIKKDFYVDYGHRSTKEKYEYIILNVIDNNTLKKFKVLFMDFRTYFNKDKAVDTEKYYIYDDNFLVEKVNDFDIQEFVNVLCEYMPEAFIIINDKYKTEELCIKMVKKNSSYLKKVPYRYRDNDELIDSAIEQSGKNLRYIPQEKRTKKRIIKAFETNPMVIKMMDREMITQEICDSAFNRDKKTIKYFPLELITVNMWVETIKEDYFMMRYVPDSMFLEVYRKVFEEDYTISAPVEFTEAQLSGKEKLKAPSEKTRIWLDVERKRKKLLGEKKNKGDIYTSTDSVVNTGPIDIIKISNNLKVIQQQLSLIEELDKKEKELLEQLNSIRDKKREAIKIISLGFGGITNE